MSGRNSGRNAGRGGRGSRGRSGGRGRGRGGGGGGNGKGGGYHGSSGNHNNNNKNNRKRQDSSKRQPTTKPDSTAPPFSNTKPKKLHENNNIKKNGEKGAEVYTVSEQDRIRFTKILMQLRERKEEEDDEGSKIEFPSTLTNTERKFIHQLAGQLGLVSKSTGKGENRRITVTKKNETKKKTTTGNEASIPMLSIGKKGKDSLRNHIAKFPPTHVEELESFETGASLVEAMTLGGGGAAAGNDAGGDGNDGDGGGDDILIAQTLDQLGLGISKQKGAQGRVQEKKTNWNQRRAKHAAFQKQKQQSNPAKFHKMQQLRSKLPAFARQAEIVETVAANPVTIIQGDTGCGKSTQCPQFLLDANPHASIVVTQRK